MLKNHIDSKHPEHGEKKHLCTLCGKGFIFKETCRLHERKHEKFPCHVCGRQFHSGAAMRDHMGAIHKFETKTYVCELCGFSTLMQKKFGVHMREKHNPKSINKCPHCDYQTPKMPMMHVHIDSKHPNHDKKTFFCDHCSKSFIFNASLKKHLNNLQTMERERAKKGIQVANKLK